jgi:hypothetical protein
MKEQLRKIRGRKEMRKEEKLGVRERKVEQDRAKQIEN